VYSKILILHFPKTEAQKPLVCNLAKDFDLTFNILRAEVLPRKEGIMVLELSGTRKKCTHCGACTAVCPTGALFIERPEMSVEFNESKCSVCELCLPVCPTRAMTVRPTKEVFLG